MAANSFPWKQIRRNYWGYIFVAPWVILYLIFGLYPLFLSFYLTFFNYSYINAANQAFVGLGNWFRGLTDPLFWHSLFNIFYNQVIFISLSLALGFASALLLKNITRFGRFFRTFYFLPMIVSTVIMMRIGTYLINPGGPIQDALLRWGILHTYIYWNSGYWVVMPVIALISAWKWFGFQTVVLLAGLIAIDPQLHEAAEIDGANSWQRFWKITVPQLNPQILFILVMNGINGLQMFTEVYMNFDYYGGNFHQALTPVLYLYAQAFDKNDMGYASTLGLLLAAIIAAITVFQFKVVRRDID